MLVILAFAASCSHPGSVNPGFSAAPAPAPASGAAPWPRPANTLALAATARLSPGVKEFFTFHVHAHLDIFVNGHAEVVPAGLGINIQDPAVHHSTVDGAPSYGGISSCTTPCIAELHTHDVSGIIHIEAPAQTNFTLGQFFAEWAVRLDGSCVGGYCTPTDSIVVFVDGKRTSGDPAVIRLTDHEEITIAIGSPPSSIPATADFSSA